MAAFFTSHSFAPRVASRRTSKFATPRTNQLRTVHLAATAARVAAAVGEVLLFLWMLGVVAFALLVIADFLQ